MLVDKDQGTASWGRYLLYRRATTDQILPISTLCHRLEPQPFQPASSGPKNTLLTQRMIEA